MKLIVDKNKKVSRAEDIVCEMVNPHFCDIIARNKHAEKYRQPADWEWIICKARDRALFPHIQYDLVFACGATDPRGITTIVNYGDSIGTGVLDEKYMSRAIRKGQEHKHFGGKTKSITSIEAWEKLQKKTGD